MLSHTENFADDAVRVPILFVNAYIVGNDDSGWVLIDSGLSGAAAYVRAVCEEHMATAPRAILLTHGHFDHAGNAEALARHWNVPIYAHRMELPFLQGRSDYPPADPSMGGAIAQMARAFPTSGYDFGNLVQALPSDGSVPGLADWQWLHTPGHTPGHVSFWRAADRTLIAGDALATFDMDSYLSHVTHERELGRSAVPFTPDWDAAEASVRMLAELQPEALAAGHGRAMTHRALAQQLERFAERPQRPDYGRYSQEPAQFDEQQGVVSVPASVPDKALPRLLLGAAAVAVLAYAVDRGVAAERRG